MSVYGHGWALGFPGDQVYRPRDLLGSAMAETVFIGEIKANGQFDPIKRDAMTSHCRFEHVGVAI
jgi:hypothetical protein